MALGMRSFALAALVAAASAIVTGIDFGNEFMKVSLVKPGQSFQIAINVASKRKTPVMLAYYSDERLFGSDAESLAARKPRVTVADPHKLLGRNGSHPSSVHYAGPSYYGLSLGSNHRGGLEVVFPLEETGSFLPGYEGAPKDEDWAAAGLLASDGSAPSKTIAYPPAGTTAFSAEELAAQLLEHAREFTETFAGGSKVRDAVITVPAYYTQQERLSLLDAAELAGYHVLALIDENTAAGIHYGIDRVTEPNTTHYMVLYNMGAESTQVTLFAYDSYTPPEKGGLLGSSAGKGKPVGQGRVVAKAWDTSLGGRWFDAALIELAVEKFNSQKASTLPKSAKGDLRNVPAAMAKLRKNVVKAKEVLSANEEISLSVESILPDVDFRMPLSRKILDEAAEKAGLWKRVTDVLDACMAQTNGTVPLSSVHVVEVVGGGVRMPKVQALLKDHLAKTAPANASVGASGAAAGTLASVGPQLGVHLNGDEAMALGAAFAAANRSAAFRVRKVGMVDAFPFPIGVRVSHLHANASHGAHGAAAAAHAAESGAADDATDGAEHTGEKAHGSHKAWTKRSALFRPYNTLDSVKRISFTADKDLKAVLFYEAVSAGSVSAPPLPEGTPRTLGVYNITGLDALMADAKVAALGSPKVHLSFELDIHGVARVIKAEATQDEEVTVVVSETPSPSPSASASASPAASGEGAAEPSASASVDPASGEAGATASASAEAPEAAADRKLEGAEASASASPAAEGAAAAADASASASAAPKTKTVKKTHKYPLTVTLDVEASGFPVRPMSAADKTAALTRLRKLKASDEAKRALESAKNALEGYIYASREKIDAAGDEWTSVTTEQQREDMSTALRTEEDWLLEDGNADLEGYKARLKALKTTVEPAFDRLRELRDREDTISRGRSAVQAGRQIVTGWATTHPQINTNETEDASEAVEEFEAWLNATVEAQDKLEGHVAPVLTSQEVTKRIRSITDLLTRLSRKPKPTPTPSPSSSKAKSSGKDGEGSEDADGEDGTEASSEAGSGAGAGKESTKDKTSSKAKAKAKPTAKPSAGKGKSGSTGSGKGKTSSSGSGKAGSKAKTAGTSKATAAPTAEAAEPEVAEETIGAGADGFDAEHEQMAPGFGAGSADASEADEAAGSTAKSSKEEVPEEEAADDPEAPEEADDASVEAGFDKAEL